MIKSFFIVLEHWFVTVKLQQHHKYAAQKQVRDIFMQSMLLVTDTQELRQLKTWIYDNKWRRKKEEKVWENE